MLTRTLTAIGHTCEEAEDGQIAVDKIKEKGVTAFDAILMDFVMVRALTQPNSLLSLSCSYITPFSLHPSSQPVMDGPAATKEIRKLSFIRPIIGCTGNTLDFDIQRFNER